MWEMHDKRMKKLKQIYQRQSKKTQLRLQEIFDSFQIDFKQLYNIADKKQKQRINDYIDEWQEEGMLKGQFGLMARNIRNRVNVKNSEILELLIYSAYTQQQNRLDDIEIENFKEELNYYYEEGQKEVNNTLKKKKHISVIPDTLFLSLLMLPALKGYMWEEYKQAMNKYNADQIYRQATINLQQQKPLKIDSDVFQGIIMKEINQKININGDKISGDVDLMLVGLANKAKEEGMCRLDPNTKVRFIAVEDNVTTKMCRSLDGQIFNAHEWNKFRRYSEINGHEMEYRCYGLIIGLNCPPIDDHFHWCRSTLIYNINAKNKELIAEYNELRGKANNLMIDMPESIDEFANLWYNKKGYADEIRTKKKIYHSYQQQAEIGKEGTRATFDKYYKNYVESQKVGPIITKDGIEVGKIKPHTLYRLSARNLTIEEMVNVLRNAKPTIDKKHESLLYTLDDKIIVSIADDNNHNIKTIMKSRGGKSK